MSRRTPTTLVCLILALHAAASAVSAAQKPPPEPPRLSFDEGRIGLFEAVRLTLAHDPNLLLQQEDVRFREGLLAEIAGAFDWNLAADLSYQHQEQELRDSVIQAEQDKRDTLSVQNEFYCTQVPRQDDKIARLEGALAGQPIVPGEFDENTDGFFLAQLRYYQELLQNAQTPQERDAILRSRTALLNRELAVARETRKQYAADLPPKVGTEIMRVPAGWSRSPEFVARREPEATRAPQTPPAAASPGTCAVAPRCIPGARPR